MPVEPIRTKKPRRRSPATAAARAAAERAPLDALPCGVPIPTGVGPDDPIPFGLTHEQEMAFLIARMRAIFERAGRTRKGRIEILHRAGIVTKKGRLTKIYR